MGIGILAGSFSLAAYFLYAASILHGQVKPSRVTWFIWALVDSITFASSLAVGARQTAFLPAAYAIGSITIAFLSIRGGCRTWNKVDRICLALSLAGIAVWLATDLPVVALTMSASASFIGSLPTMWKIYSQKEGEDRWAWSMFLIGSIGNICAIEKYEFGLAVFPLCALTVNTVTWLLSCRYPSP